MLQIIASACEFQPDRSKGTVVIESDQGGPPFTNAFQELSGMEGANLAVTFATQMGCTPAAVNGNKQGPYAVNADGVSLENVKDAQGNPLPQTHPAMQPHRYRIDVPVARRLV